VLGSDLRSVGYEIDRFRLAIPIANPNPNPNVTISLKLNVTHVQRTI